MKDAARFAKATLVWAAGLAVLIVAAGAMDSDSITSSRVLQWLASAIALAMYPASVTVAPAVLGQSRQWRSLAEVLTAALAISLVVFSLSLAAPNGDHTRGLATLWTDMRDPGASWEARNHAAWTLVTALLSGPRACLLAAIGLQVGVWGTYGVPRAWRRPLYWVVGIGLLVSGAAVWDTTYEVIVLHTAADASVAACYTLLLPLSLCAGLGLPTLVLFGTQARSRS